MITPLEEALVVGFRRITLLPLDDCHYALHKFVPALSRASLHRCLRRHDLSRLPEVHDGPTQAGWFDIHVIPFNAGKDAPCVLFAVERTSKYVFARIYPAAQGAASAFVNVLKSTCPVTLLGLCAERKALIRDVERELAPVCATAAVEYRKLAARWPSEPLDRVLRFVREETSEPIDKHGVDALGRMLARFVDHYNNHCRLKALDGLTPSAHIEQRGSAPGSTPNDESRMRATRASKQLDHPLPKREAILQCARALLASVGPEGLTLAKVARMAGVNRGTIYHNFESRDQLIAAAAEWSSEQLTKTVFAEPPEAGESDHQAHLLRVVRRLADFAIRNPVMSQAWLFQILSMPDPSKDLFWREWHSRSERFHRTPLAERGIDGEVLSVVMLAGTFLWPVWARAKCQGGNLQPFADRFVREILRMTIHGNLQAEHFADIDAKLRGTASTS